MNDSWPLKILRNWVSCGTTDLMELITVILVRLETGGHVFSAHTRVHFNFILHCVVIVKNVRFMAFENILKLGLVWMNEWKDLMDKFICSTWYRWPLIWCSLHCIGLHQKFLKLAIHGRCHLILSEIRKRILGLLLYDKQQLKEKRQHGLMRSTWESDRWPRQS